MIDREHQVFKSDAGFVSHARSLSCRYRRERKRVSQPPWSKAGDTRGPGHVAPFCDSVGSLTALVPLQCRGARIARDATEPMTDDKSIASRSLALAAARHRRNPARSPRHPVPHAAARPGHLTWIKAPEFHRATIRSWNGSQSRPPRSTAISKSRSWMWRGSIASRFRAGAYQEAGSTQTKSGSKYDRRIGEGGTRRARQRRASYLAETGSGTIAQRRMSAAAFRDFALARHFAPR